MVNMNVQYVRPARSLTTLQAELNQAWPGRQADLGFITGYPSAGNFSGHNPNNLGIVMGYDIGTYVGGSINEPDGRALAEFLRTECNEKLQYLIHDMSPGAPRPMIAGNHTGWKWIDYTGADPHSNHIHLSITDLYWGDATSVPASVYDSTSSWGIASRFGKGVKPQGSKPVPIQEDDMSAADVTAIKNHINAVLLGPYVWDDGKHPKGVRGDILDAFKSMAVENAALRAALAKIAAGGTVDLGAIEKAVEAAVTKAMADGVALDATVTIKK